MDPMHDNEYDDDDVDEYDDEYEEECDNGSQSVLHEEIHDVERPMAYVLGKPIASKMKVKRPVIFKATTKGWKSVSCEPAFNNLYVSNETWNEIEDEWLHCDMTGIEVFWEEEEFMDRINTLVVKDQEYTKSSNSYKYKGLDIYEEITFLKKRLEVV